MFLNRFSSCIKSYILLVLSMTLKTSCVLPYQLIINDFSNNLSISFDYGIENDRSKGIFSLYNLLGKNILGKIQN